MPIPDPETIAGWSPSQLAKYVQQILFDPQSLPSAMSLDALSVLGDLEVGGNALVNGIVKGFGGVATTVGPSFPVNPTGGQMHLLQLDISPFYHELMVYDERLMKWVSAVPKWAVGGDGTNEPVSTNYSLVGVGRAPRLHIPQALKFYQAGLQPQVLLSSRHDVIGTGGVDGQLQLTLWQFNYNDSGGELIFGPAAGREDTFDFSTDPTDGNILKVSDWKNRTQISGSTIDKNHWVLILDARRSTGTTTTDITINETTIGFRWVADPN